MATRVLPQECIPEVHAPVPDAPARRRAHLATKLATIAITVLFTYVALSGIDLKAAWHALQTCDYWWLIPALAAFGLGNVARALRWRSLFAPGRRPPRGATLNAMMIGYFYNSILPARAGEAARIVVLTRRSSSPAVEITGTVVLERIYDVVAILLIFFVAEPWLPHVSWFQAAAIVAAGLALAIAAAATVLAVYGDRPLRWLLRPLGRFSRFPEERLERTASELAHGLSGLHNWRVALEALFWTVLAWMFSVLCAYLVMLAFHLHLPFAAAILVQVAIGLGMILPSPPAAVGVFEGATLVALRAFGVPRSIALPYALVLHLVNFVPFVVVGAALLHYNARHPAPSTIRREVAPTQPPSEPVPHS
ncbi:MAG: lysylphosphatidylglycerol synthase transmembrane domain-containing protein [Solirubrobacteraceae bacterium]